MLIITALILLLWIGGDFVFFIMAFFLFLIIPIALVCVIASIIFMIKSRKLATTGQRVVFFWGIFNILLIVAYCVFELPNYRCNPDIMAEHYEKYAKEMDELVAYTDHALEDSAYIALEFECGEPSIFHVQAKKDSLASCNWDEDAIGKHNSLMGVVGLTKEEFENIRERLDDMGCIGIRMTQGQKWAEIWFRRVGMGMYSFRIANVPMSQEEKKVCLDKGEFIPYSDKVVFEYGGGAIGSLYFPAGQKEEFLHKHKPW